MDPMTQGQLKEWFILAATFALFGWCAYLMAAAFRRKQQNEMQKHMLEKFSSAQDFAAFMQSPSGQKYVMNFSEAAASPRNTILNSIRAGFVLMFMGVGFLAGDRGWLANRIGFVLFLAGIGFLSAALASYFLARKIWPEKE